MKSKTSKIIFAAALLSPVFALAGGGGVETPPKQETIAECQGTSGNIKSAVIYTNQQDFGPIDTLIELTINDFSLRPFFELKRQGILNLSDIHGAYFGKEILVIDPTEAIGFNSSGVFGDIDLDLEPTAQTETGTDFDVDGNLKITRAKNEAVTGPSFAIHGHLLCNANNTKGDHL